MGTRLRQVVPDVPKPLAPIRGRPFLEYLLDYWIGQGVTDFILSVGYRHDLIQKRFGVRYRQAHLTYVVEPRPLGTGGGIVHAVRQCHVKGPFLLMNGDTYCEVEWRALKEKAECCAADGCIAIIRAPQADRYLQLVVEADGAIKQLTKEKACIGDHANGGVYWLHADLFRSFSLEGNVSYSLEHDLLPTLLRNGRRFYGVEGSGAFIDIGLPADYERAASVLN
ncbi:MAG: NTP transferase domain-containing protein [Nitrospira sp.]|nr:NTP transferase domain-containing protein [Nitrospira sp.]